MAVRLLPDLQAGFPGMLQHPPQADIREPPRRERPPAEAEKEYPVPNLTGRTPLDDAEQMNDVGIVIAELIARSQHTTRFLPMGPTPPLEAFWAV